MKIYLATWMLEISQGETLIKKNYFQRLLSYFHTKDKTNSEVKTYIKTGR